MGLLLLSTIAYLPLVGVVLLNIIAPARRILAADSAYGTADTDASRKAARQRVLGIGLIAGLTLAQCGALLYSVHALDLAVATVAHKSFVLARLSH